MGALHRRRLAWVAVLALLANLAAHAGGGAVLAAPGSAAAAHGAVPGGAVIVVCTPEGPKQLAWTPDGYVPLEGSEGHPQPCPLCAAFAGGALLPEPPAVLLHRTGPDPAQLPASAGHRPAARHGGPPPVRGPPRAA